MLQVVFLLAVLGAPEVPMAPVSIHAEPESTFIHAEPPPPALHIEPAPKLEPRLAESTVRAERAESLPRNAPEIPKVSLELPPDSGLVLVETSHAAPPPVDETEVRRGLEAGFMGHDSRLLQRGIPRAKPRGAVLRCPQKHRHE